MTTCRDCFWFYDLDTDCSGNPDNPICGKFVENKGVY